jgi:hypothetical protein
MPVTLTVTVVPDTVLVKEPEEEVMEVREAPLFNVKVAFNVPPFVTEPGQLVFTMPPLTDQVMPHELDKELIVPKLVVKLAFTNLNHID